MFDHVVHCDWSMRAAGRWAARAQRNRADVWQASGPHSVGDTDAFVTMLTRLAAEGPTLAAFDFPIGVPAGFGAGTGHPDFAALLDALDHGEWPSFFDVAARPDEVGTTHPLRPFYPARPGGARLSHLLDGHGAIAVTDLMRACEHAGPQGPSAGCMFWTMGAKQVGKAALHGWRAVVMPARRQGARLWPFEDALAALSREGLTLAESYPGDAYGQLGLRFGSKRDIAERRSVATVLLARAAAIGLHLDEGLRAAVLAGFPRTAGSDDGFDAVVGLVAAIAVARGNVPAAPPITAAMRRWEGWILGKSGTP